MRTTLSEARATGAVVRVLTSLPKGALIIIQQDEKPDREESEAAAQLITEVCGHGEFVLFFHGPDQVVTIDVGAFDRLRRLGWKIEAPA